MGREEGSGWGTHVYLWQIHFDIWRNQYNIVKLNKIKKKKKMAIGIFISIITLNVNGLNAPINWLNGYKNKTHIYAVYKTPTSGGWEDGRELGQGDHFLLHKFIERTFEC